MFSSDVCGCPVLLLINTLFPQLVSTNGECSLALADQCQNAIETHEAWQLEI